MNPQLHHIVAFTHMADQLRDADRRRRVGVRRARREIERGRRERRPHARLLRRYA
ncbi:MAG TPA: hypothetical protein VF587_06470 [Solirubrobacteraceae bacterium]